MTRPALIILSIRPSEAQLPRIIEEEAAMAATPAQPAAPVAAPKAPKLPKVPLTLGQQRFRLVLLLVATVVGAVAAVAYFKPDAPTQTAIFTIIGTGFLGPLKDAFRHFFPGGQADQPHGQ